MIQASDIGKLPIGFKRLLLPAIFIFPFWLNCIYLFHPNAQNTSLLKILCASICLCMVSAITIMVTSLITTLHQNKEDEEKNELKIDSNISIFTLVFILLLSLHTLLFYPFKTKHDFYDFLILECDVILYLFVGINLGFIFLIVLKRILRKLKP